ncbi:MAG: phage major capsid protein [Dehalococcoidia bacterium]|nr:phage major capsid protein [Dehalococcoidia bacterium]
MALTLPEAAKLSNDVVQAGVIETLVYESPVLADMPFIEIVGNGLTYNRENAAPSAAFYDVGDDWDESTPTFTQATAALKILGGDADVDRFLSSTRRNVQDLDAAVLQLKARALAHTFEETVIYGDDTIDTKSFDGWQVLCAAGQRVNMGSGTTPAALTIAKLRETIDLVKPGKPDALYMSRRTRRGLSTFAQSSGSPISYEPGEFGQRVTYFDGVPIKVCDWVTDTELLASGDYSASTGGASTSVFAVKWGEGLLAGLHNGPFPQIEDLGQLETKDAKRWRVKAYASQALFSTLALAICDGISSAAVTA